ncbi:zinc transport system ATP-binding protein [Salsuginibacillus halophilus]|uniref:Zinc transport system ATP-binding protein n=1 Tax=Salsuginibacillus halophilus TaxID=517424 RepID=A0A2P8HFK6_9BACI|nr:metal ABC transporter ATP-binding protein [Salsuginibacillus halophilus]PSL45000.1 zinc transport system ATP-binding protein [Salsuginibacillus halophilus]
MTENENPVVEIDHLTYRYGSQNVLEDISLTVEPGSFVGLVGPNGSGKSTLVKSLLGLLSPQSGSVKLFGRPQQRFKAWSRIGYVSQKANSFNAGFPATVFEVVSMGLYGKVGMLRFLNRKHKQQVREAIQAVGMSEYEKRNIGELSGGQQQRVFIARALVSEPELLILDEPTVGVDAYSVQSFYDLLSELNQERGLTLLLITHDIGAMTRYVTDVACLNKHLHFHGTPGEFERNQDLSAFYGHDVQLITHEHEPAHAGGGRG